MEKQKTLFLSLTTVSNSIKTPTYSVRVDEEHVNPTSVTDVEPLRQKIEYRVTKDSFNKIEIELSNKGPNDTVVIDNKIVEDLFLIVEDLAIDKINFLNNLSKISVYKDIQGNIHRTYNYISFNGILSIKIHKNPIYTNWLASLL